MKIHISIRYITWQRVRIGGFIIFVQTSAYFQQTSMAHSESQNNNSDTKNLLLFNLLLSQILSLAENIENILNTHPQGLHFNLPLNVLDLAVRPGCQK